MALLDVNEPLHDPLLIDSFTVIRRAETFDLHGRPVIAEQTMQAQGVVCAIGPSSLNRSEDYQNMPRTISIVTQFRLQSAVQGRQPDVVVWFGVRFIVKSVDPYPQFGRGFMQCEATSMQLEDAPLDGTSVAASGAMTFNSANASSLIPLLRYPQC